jgi:hypothetical protein
VNEESGLSTLADIALVSHGSINRKLAKTRTLIFLCGGFSFKGDNRHCIIY